MKRIQVVNDISLFFILAVVALILFYVAPYTWEESFLSGSFLIMVSLFLSLFFEAIPFLLAGVLISGVIQVFVREEHIQKLLPKHPILTIIAGCSLGAIFPACECGIVPIIRRLLRKGVPLYGAIAFMLTGPLINPLVAFSTYVAFGHDVMMMVWRFSLGFIAACIIAFLVYLFYNKGPELKHTKETLQVSTRLTPPLSKRFTYMGKHAIEEFFEMSKFFILGALLAAIVQTYLSSSTFFVFGESKVVSIAVMMGFAYILSLCSEADAFIAASFSHLMPKESLLAFLLYGPMLDLKNTLMLAAIFKLRFVLFLMIAITVVVFSVVIIL
ncbi:permease [Bacillus alkalicellulosilyticus]|uniref:permease n=1 Tax=Alkalihalobacterium alkalicellulosilyticum TaxID=1912214 RepID=UPI001116DC7C|nr:permease [Bacillus alkalicellulosilyticus]